jgi:hypothetical protein
MNRYQKIADELLEGTGITVEWHPTHTGTAWARKRHIRCRPVKTRITLFYFLHELGHIGLRHWNGNGKTRHREEYEAEMFAIDTMTALSIPVPRKEVLRAKGYVAWKIQQAVRRGAKRIDRDAARWARVILPKGVTTT